MNLGKREGGKIGSVNRKNTQQSPYLEIVGCRRETIHLTRGLIGNLCHKERGIFKLEYKKVKGTLSDVFEDMGYFPGD